MDGAEQLNQIIKFFALNSKIFKDQRRIIEIKNKNSKNIFTNFIEQETI